MVALVKVNRGTCDGCGARNVPVFPVDGAPLSGGALCEKCMGLELDDEQRASIDRMLDACERVDGQVAQLAQAARE